MKAIFTIALMSVLLTGCSTLSNIPMSGNTVATGRLKADVFNLLPSYAAVTTGCRQPIKAIHTDIIQTPGQMKSNRKGQSTKGVFKERWLLTMCGEQHAIILTFTPDGQGGSYISMSKENP